MTRLKVQKIEPLRLEYEDVLRALRTDTPPTVTGEEGLAILKIIHRLLDPSLEQVEARQMEVQYANRYA